MPCLGYLHSTLRPPPASPPDSQSAALAGEALVEEEGEAAGAPVTAGVQPAGGEGAEEGGGDVGDALPRGGAVPEGGEPELLHEEGEGVAGERPGGLPLALLDTHLDEEDSLRGRAPLQPARVRRHPGKGAQLAEGAEGWLWERVDGLEEVGGCGGLGWEAEEGPHIKVAIAPSHGPRFRCAAAIQQHERVPAQQASCCSHLSFT